MVPTSPQTLAGRRVMMINRPRTWAGGDFTEFDGFARVLATRGVDVAMSVHVPDAPVYPLYHLYNAGWSWSAQAAERCRQLGRPYVVTAIYFPRRFHAAQHPATGITLASAARILVYSDFERDAILEDHPSIPRGLFDVVTKGIDSRFEHAADDWAQRPIAVLLAGRIDARKNTLLALQACREVGVTPVVAGQIGDATYWARCDGLPRKFVGELDQAALAALFAQARVVLVPSEFDPAPNVALEAAMAGCVVVHTVHTFIPDLEGVIWCDPKSHTSIVDGLRKALATGPRVPPGMLLASHVRKRFSWEEQTDRLLAVYDAVAHRSWRNEA